MPNFNPFIEKINCIPIWIDMYALLVEFWGEKIFKKIRTSIGIFGYMDIQIEENLTKRSNMWNTRLAIFMGTSTSWPQSITFSSRLGKCTHKI